MITKIQKWGNSLGVRIPKSLAEDAQVEEGASVELTVENGCLMILPIKRNALDLNALLEEVTPDNLHGEVDVGPAVGGEDW